MFKSRKRRSSPTLDGMPVDLMFDPSQPPITQLDDPRLPRVIDLARHMTVPHTHPCYPAFRRLRAWGLLIDDVESGRREIYSHVSRYHGQARSVNEWLDLVAGYVESRAKAA